MLNVFCKPKPLALALLLAFGSAAYAEQPSVQAGERLSNYLRRNALIPGVYQEPAALQNMLLRKPELRAQQALQQTQLKTELHLQAGNAPPYLAELISNLPATGRLLLKSTDADYLQLRPELDPVLNTDNVVQLGSNPNHVLVLLDDSMCVAPHRAGASVADYVAHCKPNTSWYQLQANIDQAWLVQPTGETRRATIGQWNAGTAQYPIPGAWIIAPSRKSRLPSAFFDKLAAYLSTQGSSPATIGTQKTPTASARRSMNELAIEPVVAIQTPLRPLPVSSNDFGLVGLMQTPTARMREAGHATVTATRVEPYSRYSIILQPFDWLETGFRYTKITNRLFGPEDFSGDQKYLDKNIDLKLRLWKESAYVPEIAAGLQDIGGTGLFSGEYLVANKRFGNVDTSLGLGFGYLGNTGDVSNPFGFVSEKFKDRPSRVITINDTGQVNAADFFRGRASVFGGVQWHTPWDKLTLKLEYEGNNYEREPLSNPQEQTSRLNYGLVYKVSDSVSFHAGVERGTTMLFGLSFYENLSTFNTPKLSDPKPLPVSPVAQAQQVDWKKTTEAFEAHTNLSVNRVEQRGSEVKLNVRNGRIAYANETLDRAAEVLHKDLPADVKWLSLEYENNGTQVGQHVIDREKFVQRRTQYTEAEIDHPDQVSVEGFNMPYRTVYEEPTTFFENKTSIGYRQVLGGADGLLYQFILANDTKINFSDSTWINGRLAYRLIDNFEKFKQRGFSNLPQVRSNLREYAVTSEFTIPSLALKHMGKVGDNHFYGVYGGLLEQMFAGVGAEYLYRPHNSRYAIGIDVNRVRQRAFEQDFDLQPYVVNTGHITAYIDTGIQDIQAAISAGQYLAGDRGVTVDLSREFNNGVRMGAFATRTNVSAVDFGEGSFDKGIYVTIPFSAFFTKTIPGDAVFLWRPLTRDGGAKLNRGLFLLSETEVRNLRGLKRRAGVDFD